MTAVNAKRTLAVTPVATVVATATYQGADYLFARGLDNGLYVGHLDGGAWSSWSQAPGQATLAAPAVAVYNGALRVVYRGTDDRIHWTRYDGRSWTGLPRSTSSTAA